MANDSGDRVTPAIVTFTDTEQVAFSWLSSLFSFFRLFIFIANFDFMCESVFSRKHSSLYCVVL